LRRGNPWKLGTSRQAVLIKIPGPLSVFLNQSNLETFVLNWPFHILGTRAILPM